MAEPIRCFMVERRADGWYRDGERLDIEHPEGYWSLPEGAMWWRTHVPVGVDADPRPMPHLHVQTPAGRFCIDCPATDEPNGHWTRTGEPPMITVEPSINIGPEVWHGHLADGELRG